MRGCTAVVRTGSKGFDHVGAAELHVGGVLMDRPVLTSALLAGGPVQVSGERVNAANDGEADRDAGSDGEEGAAHRRKQRKCTAEKGHEKPPLPGWEQGLGVRKGKRGRCP